MSVNKEHIDTLVEMLDAAFLFVDTPQGHAYWFGVLENLAAIQSRGAEVERRARDRRGHVQRRTAIGLRRGQANRRQA